AMNNANMLRGPKLLLSFANTSIEFKFVRLLRDLCWALPNALPCVTAVSELAARARGYNSLKDTLSSIGLDGHMALRIRASRLCYGLMVQSAGAHWSTPGAGSSGHGTRGSKLFDRLGNMTPRCSRRCTSGNAEDSNAQSIIAS